MMKKLATLLIALLMLCTFASADTLDYLGVWYLVSIESEGMVLNPADMGMAVNVTLNADGTGMVNATDEEEMSATWTVSGDTITITVEDEPLAFVLTDDGMLIAENEGSNMVFGREEPGPGFIPAPEILATDITEFDGTWTITKVNAYGMILPFSAMAEMGMVDGTVFIQNGSVTSFGALAAEVGTLADGKLDIVSSIEDGEMGKTISLLEDGSISMEYLGMVFYCENIKVAE